ncbi:MAG: autotransporter-associated beta strand repeat-containing protein [Phycisphaerae bacterium]
MGDTVAAPISLAGNLTLTNYSTNALTVSGNISSSTAINVTIGDFWTTNTATGLVILSGSNTYSGTTNVRGSTIAGTPVGSTLRLTNASAAGTSSISMGVGTGTGAPTLQLYSTGSTNFGNNFGALSNNDFNVVVGDATGSAATGFTHTMGNLTIISGTMNLSGGYGLTVGNLSSLGGSNINHNASGLLTINNVVGNPYAIPVNFQGSGSTVINGVISDYSGSVATSIKSSSGKLTLNGSNTYTGSTNFSGGNIYGSSDANFGLGTGAGNLNFNWGTLVATDTFELNSARQMRVVDGRANIKIATGKTLTFNGTIVGGANGIEMAAASGYAGTLSLGGTSTGLSGYILVNSNDTLRLTSAQATGTAKIYYYDSLGSGVTNLQLFNNAATNFSANVEAIGYSALNITSADGTGSAATGFTHTLGTLLINNNTVTVNGGYGLTFGDVTLANNGYLKNNASGLVSVGNVAPSPSTSGFVFTTQGTGNTAVNGVISGTAFNFQKSDGGTTTLNGVNTYGGLTYLSGGTLIVTNPSGMGVSTATTAVQPNNGTTLSLINDGTGTVVYGPGSGYNLAADTAGNATCIPTINVDRPAAGSSTNTVIQLGSLTLGIPNSFTRQLNITGGHGYSLSFGGNVSLATNSTYLFNPTTAKVSLNTVSVGSGAVLFLDGTATGNAVTGQITGAGQLYKQNTSTWTLSAANNYTGNTYVNGGKLIVNSTNTSANTDVNIGATLAGSGSLSGTVNVNNGNLTGGAATINPGAGTGTATLNVANNVTFNATNGGVLAIDIGGTQVSGLFDKLNITGGSNKLSLASTTNDTLNIIPVAYSPAGTGQTYHIVNSPVAGTGTFEKLLYNGASAGNNYTVTYGATGIDVFFTVSQSWTGAAVGGVNNSGNFSDSTGGNWSNLTVPAATENVILGDVNSATGVTRTVTYDNNVANSGTLNSLAITQTTVPSGTTVNQVTLAKGLTAASILPVSLSGAAANATAVLDLGGQILTLNNAAAKTMNIGANSTLTGAAGSNIVSTGGGLTLTVSGLYNATTSGTTGNSLAGANAITIASGGTWAGTNITTTAGGAYAAETLTINGTLNGTNTFTLGSENALSSVTLGTSGVVGGTQNWSLYGASNLLSGTFYNLSTTPANWTNGAVTMSIYDPKNNVEASTSTVNPTSGSNFRFAKINLASAVNGGAQSYIRLANAVQNDGGSAKEAVYASIWTVSASDSSNGHYQIDLNGQDMYVDGFRNFSGLNGKGAQLANNALNTTSTIRALTNAGDTLLGGSFLVTNGATLEVVGGNWTDTNWARNTGTITTDSAAAPNVTSGFSYNSRKWDNTTGAALGAFNHFLGSGSDTAGNGNTSYASTNGTIRVVGGFYATTGMILNPTGVTGAIDTTSTNPNYLDSTLNDVIIRAGNAQTLTAVSTGTGVFTAPGNRFPNGSVVFLAGSTPTGLALFTNYYVINSTAGSFQLSTTPGGSAIIPTSTGGAGQTAYDANSGLGNATSLPGLVVAGTTTITGNLAMQVMSGSATSGNGANNSASIFQSTLRVGGTNVASTNVSSVSTVDGTLTLASGSVANGQAIYLSGTTLPTGLTAGQVYYAIGASGSTFKVAAYAGGPAIIPTAAGSGVTSISATASATPATLVVTGDLTTESRTITDYIGYSATTLEQISRNVNNVIGNGSTITVTATANHNLAVGDIITVGGIGAGFNATNVAVTGVLSPTVFTYANTGNTNPVTNTTNTVTISFSKTVSNNIAIQSNATVKVGGNVAIAGIGSNMNLLVTGTGVGIDATSKFVLNGNKGAATPQTVNIVPAVGIFHIGDGSGGTLSGTAAQAKLTGTLTVAGSLDVNGSASQLDLNGQTISFTGTPSLALGGKLLASVNSSFSAPITLADTGGSVGGAANLDLHGNITSLVSQGLTKVDAGTTTLFGTNTYSGGTTVTGGTLVFDAANARPASGVLTLGKDANGGAKVVFTSLTGATTNTVRTELLGGTTFLKAGSVANEGIGYLTTDQYDALNGASLASGGVVAKYTYLGDVTLDGKITAADFAQIDASYLKGTYSSSGAKWFNGDFNYDGAITSADFAIIDAAYTAQGGPLAAGIVAGDMARFAGTDFAMQYQAALSAAGTVPEPASLGLLALGALGLLGRRRR